MSDYAEIDATIADWAKRNALSLCTTGTCADLPRNVYLSSIAGECFQIWVDPPKDGKVCIHAAYVEGPKDPEPYQDWVVETAQLGTALDGAMRLVLGWMAPSERYFPSR